MYNVYRFICDVRGNLSLRTFLTYFFFIRKFSNFRICLNLVGFNRINSIVILLNVQNQLREKQNVSYAEKQKERYWFL